LGKTRKYFIHRRFGINFGDLHFYSLTSMSATK
jgi:hypothetical protein